MAGSCAKPHWSNPGVGEVFSAAVRAIEDKSAAGLDKLFAVAEAVPESLRGLISAFGWVSSERLKGTTKDLLASGNAFRRQVGIAACAMHRVDPAAALDTAMTDANAELRARALRVAGECGRRDRKAACMAALTDEDAICRFWAARSAVLLGDRDAALAVLHDMALQAGPCQRAALQCLLKLCDIALAHGLLKKLAQDTTNLRLVIEGVGIVGDPYYVPWLIKQMADDKLTRLAGEAFTFITGLDLSYLDLDRKPPGGVDFGPNDNPDDGNVDMDPDDSLPWPDVAKVQEWWNANGSRYPPGTRHFMGEPVNADNCRRVLREGFQRQRIAASFYLSLLQPGTPLFPTSAPAWRQQRWLANPA